MKRFLKSFCLASVLAVMAAAPVNAALLLNGDFKNPSEPPNQYLTPGQTIPGWTVIGTGGVTVHHVNENDNVWPGNSSQFMDLTGNTGNGGIQSDAFSTVAGQAYRVTFDAFNGSLVHPGTAFTGPAFSLQASGGALTQYSLTAGISYLLSYNFTASGNSTTLSFMDLSGFDSNAGWIDNVALTAVPEPATILAGALLLLPFGASTIRILRRKAAASL